MEFTRSSSSWSIEDINNDENQSQNQQQNPAAKISNRRRSQRLHEKQNDTDKESEPPPAKKKEVGHQKAQMAIKIRRNRERTLTREVNHHLPIKTTQIHPIKVQMMDFFTVSKQSVN